MTTRRFSDRHGFEPAEAEITVRHDAPADMREALVDIAEEVGLAPRALRTVLCRVLHVPADESNWTEYPNIDEEVRSKLADAEWPEVYDFIEALDAALSNRSIVTSQLGLSSRPEQVQAHLRERVNKYFRKAGIGWRLVEGRIEIRGSDLVEETLEIAQEALDTTDRATAHRELREARQDLSRRPEPDITGAIQHALAALECVARHVSGRTETLGALVERDSTLFPPPLDQVVKKLFGFASEMGRHLHEGREPSFEDAQLTVSVAAAIVTHLVRRAR